MLFENELRLICDTLRKCHVYTAVVSVQQSASELFENEVDSLLGRAMTRKLLVKQVLGELEPETMYKAVDELNLCYRYLLLPNESERLVLFIGPYLNSPFSSEQMLELGERLKISPKAQHYLNEYFMGIPVLAENSHLFVLINTFCERIWGSPSFAIVDVNNEPFSPVSPINESAQSDNVDDVFVNMKTMEQRYNFENELMTAVSLGQIHKESLFLSGFSDNVFEKRATDPLRNLKNYCIITNTLLRKAAENGGVHPLYLDRVSSDFAQKIELLPTVSDNVDLIKTMFRSYCNLVREHSMKSYSSVVQKTIISIDSDLSADLSLSSLAESQKVSAGYLSTVFKKETGKTVTEYIREKRIKYAKHLLATTQLQVQTVALHCGILDVQYFSKIFKKSTGKTPKEYRDSIK